MDKQKSFDLYAKKIQGKLKKLSKEQLRFPYRSVDDIDSLNKTYSIVNDHIKGMEKILSEVAEERGVQHTPGEYNLKRFVKASEFIVPKIRPGVHKFPVELN